MLDLLPNTANQLRDVTVARTYKVRVNGSLAIGGFATPTAARRHFARLGIAPADLTITPESTLVIR